MTLDEKLAWTFKWEQSYYSLRLRRSNSIRANEAVELFLDGPTNDVMQRSVSQVQYTMNCTSWKQAMLYTFFNQTLLKINVKGVCYIFGRGYIINTDGIVLVDYSHNIIDRSLLIKSNTSKSLEETFVKNILPLMASLKREIKIKDSSSFRQIGDKPKLIGKQLNDDLIECAKNSLALLEL